MSNPRETLKQMLAEEYPAHVTFDYILDQLVDEVERCEREGDDTVVIAPPSYAELSFPLDFAIKAMIGTSS